MTVVEDHERAPDFTLVGRRWGAPGRGDEPRPDEDDGRAHADDDRMKDGQMSPGQTKVMRDHMKTMNERMKMMGDQMKGKK
jgi:hypothetical protein